MSVYVTLVQSPEFDGVSVQITRTSDHGLSQYSSVQLLIQQAYDLPKHCGTSGTETYLKDK